MAFENMLKRRGRVNRQQAERPAFEYANIAGVDYASSISAIPPNKSPFGQNADFGAPMGAIPKVLGYEAVIPSLGAGGMKGLHPWKHSTGEKLLAAQGKDLYLLSGSAESKAVSSQADWQAGVTKTHVDTTTSAGDIKIEKGTDFSETDTATADFNGTHSHTEATGDKVQLAVETTSAYSANKCTGGSIISWWVYGNGPWVYQPSYIFDGNANTHGAESNNYLQLYSGDYIGYLFPSTVHIRRIRVKHYWIGYAPSSMTLKRSSDGSSWTTVATLTPTTADQTFDIPESGASQYWALFSDETSSSKTWSIYEIEMMEIDPNHYYASGTYAHTEQDPSSVKVAGINSITFNTTTPVGTSATLEVQISEDEGDTFGGWVAKASGDSIVPVGTDISRYRFNWRVNFTTTDPAVTPALTDVTISITANYYEEAEWVGPVYDLVNTPLTNILTFTNSTPGGTTITWFARGSGNGTIFGDWREISVSGAAIPLQRYIQIKMVLTSTGAATPTVSDFLISFSASYTAANKLDISPLGRTNNELSGNRVRFCDYQDWLLCADGLRPFMVYISTATQRTGTAAGGAAGYIQLDSGASAVDDFYNNSFVTITGGTGAGQTRWISDYTGSNKRAIPSVEFSPAPDATSTFSIGSAYKVRNLGVNPPATAPTLADSGVSGSPSGAYLYKVTFVNADGIESNPSPASSSITVSSKKINLSTIPLGDSNTAKRRIYRTAAGGAVYKYLAEIADNTTTTYQDNTADSALGALMYDNNNVPPNCSLVYEFTSYVFYCTGYFTWFSKAGSPDQVPNITGDKQVRGFPGNVATMGNHPMALVVGGPDFLATETSGSGFIFDSDLTVDTTTQKVVDAHGGLSHEATRLCLSPNLRSTLLMNTDTGIRSIVPGLQENSIESIPISRDIQPYYDRSINRDQAAGVFYNNYYLYSMEHMPVGGSESERLTFALDFRDPDQMRWYGPWTFGMSCFTVIGGQLYGGDAETGKVYRMFTGNSFDGANIHMIADLPVRAPAGENRICKYHNLTTIVSADSDTTNLTLKPKVDDREAVISPGALTSSFAGDERPGHNFIRDRKRKIPLARGSTFSLRVEDNSTNPIHIDKVIVEYEVLNMDR